MPLPSNATPPLGRMLRHLRHIEQISLRELAREIGGLSAATLLRVEQGHSVDYRTWLRLMCWMTGQKLE